ncbi:MAG: pyruvate dehydrogenase complex dihydrolipoamide acetyltransferase [Flavipsychrobacter sp.]|nr:pyruvate dehydrogenase complex dihydrolipoamide acetyltransferase [Flavipsychrobacter sp.]
MAEAIRMPLLSDTMKEGVIAEWHKKVGDKVKSDDVLAEVETDKATMEVMPYVDGTLLYVGVEKGKAAKVNDIIAIIGKEGEDYKALLDSAPVQAAPAASAAPAPAAEAPKAATPAPNPGDATVIRMPLLSDTMKEGKIVAWHKKVGDKIKSDDVMAEVETDKATMEVMPYVDGVLLYTGVKEGEAAKVNDIIAIVGKAGTDVAPYLNEAPAAPQTATSAAPAQAAAPVAAVAPAASHSNSDERVKISPLAKKLAEGKGIDVNALRGSGDNGRIIKRDIDNYQPGTAPAAAPKAAASYIQAAPVGQEGYTDKPLSQMRKVIAQRLSDSMFTAPHFYLRITVTMDKAMEARKAINDVSPVKVSFNDLIIKACAMALRQHPDVNSSWMGDFIRHNQHIHIGTAVAIEDGLIVPVVKFADQKSLSQIAADAKELADKAKTKKLQPQEFTGNTFTISNLGMMGIDEFTAIINPPDSCILAVGNIVPTPVAENNQVVVRNLLKLTLSCDHRVVDGAVGARFLQTLKTHLENPVTMLV